MSGGWAVIEMAQASGLPRLAPEERDPSVTSTYGTGQMISAALDAGCRHILVGIGGSATNDGGAGMACALGARLLDADGLPHLRAEVHCPAGMLSTAPAWTSGWERPKSWWPAM